MKKVFPSLKEAEKIWSEGIVYRQTNFQGNVQDQYDEKMYIFHTQNVVKIASLLASKTVSLNPEKAYILGLLHDYGRRIDECRINKFHGCDGYEALSELGYPIVAKICLTHTFPDKNFSMDKYSYPTNWLDWAKRELHKVNYDDYDKLIQLCDKLVTGYGIVSIEHRVGSVSKRYNLTQEQHNNHLNEGLELKSFFDKLCKNDIYKIIGIKDDEF
ncbi:MAG: HD domain-containing protein [Alphaproteobacteria bacterium]